MAVAATMVAPKAVEEVTVVVMEVAEEAMGREALVKEAVGRWALGSEAAAAMGRVVMATVVVVAKALVEAMAVGGEEEAVMARAAGETVEEGAVKAATWVAMTGAMAVWMAARGSQGRVVVVAMVPEAHVELEVAATDRGERVRVVVGGGAQAEDTAVAVEAVEARAREGWARVAVVEEAMAAAEEEETAAVAREVVEAMARVVARTGRRGAMAVWMAARGSQGRVVVVAMVPEAHVELEVAATDRGERVRVVVGGGAQAEDTAVAVEAVEARAREGWARVAVEVGVAEIRAAAVRAQVATGTEAAAAVALARVVVAKAPESVGGAEVGAAALEMVVVMAMVVTVMAMVVVVAVMAMVVAVAVMAMCIAPGRPQFHRAPFLWSSRGSRSGQCLP